MVKKILFFIFASTIRPTFSQSYYKKAIDAYEKGRINEAITAISEYNHQAQLISDPLIRFSASITTSWFYAQISDYKTAITHAFQGKILAEDMKSNYAIARANSYLGWSFISIGGFKAAEQYLIDAIKISAPNFITYDKEDKMVFNKEPEILFPMIWGLSTQELGNLYFKTGKTKLGKSLINHTYRFARKNKVDVGISESAVYLSLIETELDNHGQAKKFAKTGLEAALRCDCSKLNKARAYYALALASLKFKDKTTQDKGVVDAISRSIAYSKENGIDYYYAKSLLLDAENDKYGTDYSREELIDEAIELLDKMESPDLSVGLLEKSKFRIKNRDFKVADQLLKKGIDLAKEKESFIHFSHLNFERTKFLSQFDLGKEKTIKSLTKQAKFAKKKNLFKKHLEISKELISIFNENQLTKLQIISLKEAIISAKIIYKREKNKSAKNASKRELYNLKKSLAHLMGSFYRESSGNAKIPKEFL